MKSLVKTRVLLLFRRIAAKLVYLSDYSTVLPSGIYMYCEESICKGVAIGR